MWIQLSWMIVLSGAEISYAYQYVDTYEFEPDGRPISPAFKKLLSLQISHLVISRFFKAEPPLSAFKIAKTLEIPIRLVQQLLDELVEAKILSDTEAQKNKDVSYQPARDINAITINTVIEALEQNGVDNIPVAQTTELSHLSQALKTLNEEIEKSPSNRLLKDI